MHILRITLCIAAIFLSHMSASAQASPLSLADFDIEAKADRILTQAADIPENILELALTAYQHAAAEGKVMRPYLTIIDYSQPSDQKRLWVVNLANNTVPYKTLVAHGKNSGTRVARHFSNRAGSHASSFGVFVTGKTYSGSKGYSMRLNGLEKGINDRALARAIVMHGAKYVSSNFLARAGRLGRSWGCPAVPTSLAKPIINRIKNGSMVFAYYPDQNWLTHSKYLA